MSTIERLTVAIERLVREIRDRLPLGNVPDDRQRTQFNGVELPLVLSTVPSNAPFDIRKFGNFTKVWEVDTHHYTKGLVLVQVDSVKPPAVVLFAAEVQIVGYISGVPDLLSVAFVNSLSGPFPLTFFRSYDYLRAYARQIVNGVPDSTTDSPKLEISVTARMER